MVAIDCLLTCVHCFLHRCEALWQRVLNVSQLHVHNNVGPLKKQAGYFRSCMQIQLLKRTESKIKKWLVIFGGLGKENVEIIESMIY